MPINKALFACVYQLFFVLLQYESSNKHTQSVARSGCFATAKKLARQCHFGYKQLCFIKKRLALSKREYHS